MRTLLPLLALLPLACQAPSSSVAPSEATASTTPPASDPAAVPAPPPPPPEPLEEPSPETPDATIGAGGSEVGPAGQGSDTLIGKGGGSTMPTKDSSSDEAGRGKRVAMVRLKKVEVEGAMDSDIVRRIVRAHVNEVRECYNTALDEDPDTSGLIEIEFVIASTGKVKSSQVARSSVTGGDPGPCIVKAVKRWKFPKTKDGKTARVRYPFDLSPPGA